MYCIDTSSLIAAWDERYPPDFFPRFWDNLAAAIEVGRIMSTEEVLTETSKRSKDLNEWLKQYPDMFIPLEEDVQVAVRDILRNYPRLVGLKKQRTSADPFVIATAVVRGFIVVTEEGRTGSLNKPHIPDVCGAVGVDCISLIDLIRAEKWVSG